MTKATLSVTQVKDFVEANKYKIDPKTRLISRCIDGRYQVEHGLPALAIAGADAGEAAVIFATANIYGFKVEEAKVFQTIGEVVGGVENLRFHTDEHADTEIIMDGCGYIRHKTLSPKDFNVTSKQVEFIKKKAHEAIKKGAVQEVLLGDHQESAVLLIGGPYGVYPGYALMTSEGKVATQVFEFHRSLVNERHAILSKALIKNKAVKLFEGCDEEYLYEVISSTTDDHLMEIAKRLAKDLPMYSVSFNERGNFTLEEVGKVE